MIAHGYLAKARKSLIHHGKLFKMLSICQKTFLTRDIEVFLYLIPKTVGALIETFVIVIECLNPRFAKYADRN